MIIIFLVIFAVSILMKNTMIYVYIFGKDFFINTDQINSTKCKENDIENTSLKPL